MIWVRKAPQGLAVKRTGLSRAFNLLIFQTCFFGVAVFVVVTVSASIHPAPWWLQSLLVVALIGFAGGIIGSFIAFGMLSSQDARGAAEE